MNRRAPSLDELHELISHVHQHAPEYVATVDYLLSVCRQLSVLTLENILSQPDDEELSLEIYRRVAMPGTLPDDLEVVVHQRWSRSIDEKERRRLLQLQKLIDKLQELEARQKIERLFL